MKRKESWMYKKTHWLRILIAPIHCHPNTIGNGLEAFSGTVLNGLREILRLGEIKLNPLLQKLSWGKSMEWWSEILLINLKQIFPKSQNCWKAQQHQIQRIPSQLKQSQKRRILRIKYLLCWLKNWMSQCLLNENSLFFMWSEMVAKDKLKALKNIFLTKGVNVAHIAFNLYRVNTGRDFLKASVVWWIER